MQRSNSAPDMENLASFDAGGGENTEVTVSKHLNKTASGTPNKDETHKTIGSDHFDKNGNGGDDDYVGNNDNYDDDDDYNDGNIFEEDEEDHHDYNGGAWGKAIITDIRLTLGRYWCKEMTNFDQKTIAVSFFIFFAAISPAITFGAIYAKATNNYIGAVEMITATAWCGIVYALIGGQP